MPTPDLDAIADYAAEFEAATGLSADGVPYCFGDSADLADELGGLVLAGRKRATAGPLAEFRHDGEPVAQPGTHSVVYGGDGRPMCVLRTDEVRVGPLDDVLDPAGMLPLEAEEFLTSLKEIEGLHTIDWEARYPAGNGFDEILEHSVIG